jgi:cysteine desulfurase
MPSVYLDHNATTRPHPDVVREMLPLLGEAFGNPSSLHGFAEQARRALELGRQRVASLIGAEAEEIVFTSGGTEANNAALFGVARSSAGAGQHIITSAIEHQAVLNCTDHLARLGFRVTRLPVDASGWLDPARVASAITDETRLVSVMLANNEVGTLQSVREVGNIAHERGVLVHSDAVQALGKVPIDVKDLGVDLLSLSGHKIYGPQGIGALFVRSGVGLEPLLFGGHQERGRRPGTENVAAAAGFGRAALLARERLELRARHLLGLLERLERGIFEAIPDCRLNGHPTRRLPNTLNVTFPGLDGELLLMSLAELGVAVSTGSACHATSHEPSHVLLAMGRSPEEASGSLRFSLGEENTEAEIDYALGALRRVVGSLRIGNGEKAARVGG